MKLKFNNIKPLSFEYTQKENSIWGNKVSIESPEICKIIASSGSGKSTLISILTGLRPDYSGDILFDDKSAIHFSSNEWSSLRSKKLSVVYQDLRLFRNLTVRQNLQLSQHITEQQSNNDLIEELDSRGHLVDGDGKEILEAIYEKRRIGKDYQSELDQLIWNSLGKVL